MLRQSNRELARGDLRKLRDHRRIWGDRRRRVPTAGEALSRRLWTKMHQFDMALHRRGLTSPYDYTYPRLDRMNKLARELHDRHIAPLQQQLRAMEEA